MEGANPEVRLALSVERQLRRPAAQLRAVLAAAERHVEDDAPVAELLAGARPLTVLAALLDPVIAADPVADRLPRGPHGLAPVARLPASRQGSAASGGPAPRATAAPEALGGNGRHGAARNWPDRSTKPVGLASILPASAGRAARGGAIAQARDTLRRAVAVLPQSAAVPASLAAPDVGHGGDAVTAHALVAAARASRRSADAAAASEAPGGAPDSVAAGWAQTDAAAHPDPTAASLSTQPQPGPQRAPDVPARPVRALASRAAPAHFGPCAASLRNAAPLALTRDSADALAEAAWRNGVDLS